MPQQIAGGFAGNIVLDQGPFLTAWKSHADHAATLGPRFSAPRIEPLTPLGQKHVEELKKQPNFEAIYGTQVEFKMIELGKLLAAQYWVDCDVSDGVHGAGVVGPPDEQKVLESCLPHQIVPPAPTRWQQIGPHSFIIYSPNNTLCLASAATPATGEVKYVLGAGANLMMVRAYGGRYMLANGYHRAWLLRSRNVELVPVVVANASSEKDVELGPEFIGSDILFGPRPPIVDDFLDDSISLHVDVRATFRAVKLTAELFVVPRLI